MLSGNFLLCFYFFNLFCGLLSRNQPTVLEDGEYCVFTLNSTAFFYASVHCFFLVEILSVYGYLCKMSLSCGSTFGNASRSGCFLFVCLFFEGILCEGVDLHEISANLTQ